MDVEFCKPLYQIKVLCRLRIFHGIHKTILKDSILQKTINNNVLSLRDTQIIFFQKETESF